MEWFCEDITIKVIAERAPHTAAAIRKCREYGEDIAAALLEGAATVSTSRDDLVRRLIDAHSVNWTPAAEFSVFLLLEELGGK